MQAAVNRPIDIQLLTSLGNGWPLACIRFDANFLEAIHRVQVNRRLFHDFLSGATFDLLAAGFPTVLQESLVSRLDEMAAVLSTTFSNIPADHPEFAAADSKWANFKNNIIGVIAFSWKQSVPIVI